MALIGGLCRKNSLINRLFLRKYTSSVAYDYDRWELAYPLSALTAAQADGHMVSRGVQWVFIGSPGVEKSAYASKLAELLNVPHISMGNLVREELRVQSSLSKQLSAAVSQGKLLPDNIIFKLLSKRWELGDRLGETGFILDGFPRTRMQAEILDRVADIDMAINFKCKEEANLIKRCLGRRTCSHCGRTFHVANTDSKVTNVGFKIHMPPAQSFCTCLGKLVTGASDAEEILKEKLRIYSEQSKALEAHYCNQKKLLNFEVPGGKQETWTGLLAALDLKDVDKTSQQLTC
ncbi:hypothetical protein SUGI_0415550 [Cryptomeria japonica]|uniref:adenylate kinase 1, chloroplastic n=1 Tax=Cryptomeria japonica TaxID=3369 RepID=UPI002408DA70|nr:adenylate kinase 1, chloroplastic [Cryptomeria japonica]GLJ22138.1 hypothetical protein SUGI_0415550 [Cryptomeria japonica]